MLAQVSDTALRLLRELLQAAPGGRVFTSDEAVAAGTAVGLSPNHTYKLLSELTRRGILERPRGRLYVMAPPLGGAVPVAPIAIAVRAVEPSAVSGDSALVHWGLLDQAPLHEEVVSTSARIQWTHPAVQKKGRDRLWTLSGTTIRFRHVPGTHMIGIARVFLDRETVVPMFDRERTIVDLVTYPDASGIEWTIELLRTHKRDINLARLKSYAATTGVADRLNQLLSTTRLHQG